MPTQIPLFLPLDTASITGFYGIVYGPLNENVKHFGKVIIIDGASYYIRALYSCHHHLLLHDHDQVLLPLK